MSKRSILVNVFKMHGLTWMHRRYKKNGEWRNCYAPKWGETAPIFSKSEMNRSQLSMISKKQLEKDRAKIMEAADKIKSAHPQDATTARTSDDRGMGRSHCSYYARR